MVVKRGQIAMRRVATLVVCVWALAASGCGYALAGRGSFLPATIRTVGIPKLENRTTFFQVEDMLTDKIRAEFIGRGKYTVSPEAAGADAVLTGTVLCIVGARRSASTNSSWRRATCSPSR